MKKILLIASAFLFTLAGVAQEKQQATELAKEVVKQATIQKADDGTRIVHMPYNPSESAYAQTRADEEYKVGITQYDLQTNSDLGSRFFRFADGTIGATWTGGIESAPAFPDRGSFYNYWDGQEWVIPFAEVGRIEEERRGWPSYGPYGEMGEAVFSHADGIAMYTREVKGQGEWVKTTPLVSSADNTWPRYCNNNGTIHLLEGYQVSAVNKVLYSRSQDNGATWSPQGIQLPEIGTDFYTDKSFSADDYVWAEPRNGVIAFALFSSTADLVLMKSTDDGETWQKTIVWEHPIPQFDYTTTAYTDTCVAPNGTGQIAIDDEGKVHMVFGTCATEFREPSDDGSYYYFPLWGHLMYWNEDMDTFTGSTNQYRVLDPQVNEALFDNNSLVLLYGLDFDGDFFPQGENTEQASYRQLGPIQGASLAYGEDNKMYCAFSARDERRIITGEDGASYCATQVFLTSFKYDEGLDEWVLDQDWCTPEEGDMVTENAELDYSGFFRVNGHFLHGKDECVYPQIVVQPGDDPKANMYVFFQVDSKPGLALDENNAAQTSYTDNVITMWANTKDFSSPTIPEGNSIEESTAIENTMEVYPNPITDGKVNVVVKEANNCVIYNILGQVVAEQKLSAGVNTVSVSNLNSGVYFITAGTLTQKIVIK